jgi:hypothetical protein
VPASEDPDVAALCDRFFRRSDHDVRIYEVIVYGIGEGGSDLLILLLRVAAQLERDLSGVDMLENVGQQLRVGFGQLGDPVVGCQICELAASEA